MLVLSRKLGESLVIADSIIVTITQIDRGKVRLGIKAPPNVPIVRQELHGGVLTADSAATALAAGT
jgi:carbon storage regulator